jgi:hypothetical protein
MRVLRLLGATAVASAVVSTLFVMPAEAASWAGQSNGGATFETCTKARKYNKVAYTTCIQYASAHTKVRVVIRVQTTARRSVAGNPYLRVPGRSNNLSTRSCSGTLASGAKKQCATGWLKSNRIVQVGEGSVKVGSSKRPAMRVRGMRLNAKKQENSAKYCGPATVQAALRTLKGSAPSQDTLANSNNLQTNRYGFTYPGRLAGVLNKYRSGTASKYKLYDFGPSGQSSELAFRQLYRSIDAGNPVVYLVDPSRLPWSSNPAGTNVRHYILLHGYSAYKTSSDTNLNGGWIAERFSAWDPADGKRHNISAIDLLNSSNGSQYIDDDMVFAAK